MIRIENLTVRFGNLTALKVESLAIDTGDRIAITGANGSGKSTLLRVLAGLQTPTTGKMSGLPRRGRVTLVHQSPYMFRGSAWENVEWAIKLQGRPMTDSQPWIDTLGIREFAHRSARDLSGGEQRRIAIARALSIRPSVLLLDEPFDGLDGAGSVAVRKAIQEYPGTVVIAGPEVDGELVDREFSLGESE